MNTECACLCTPSGHDYLICGHTAQPGMFARLAGRLDFPVCRPCYEARRAQEPRPAAPGPECGDRAQSLPGVMR
jgi:hypothetical protein